MNIVLTGFMCTGKTSAGRLLAERAKFEYVDTDDLIIEREKMSIADVFSTKGEPYFRDVESAVIAEAAKRDSCVIATGGGAVMRPGNRVVLRKSGIIVNLTAKPETVIERLKAQPGVRPLLDKPDPLAEAKKLLEAREKAYADCDLRIATDVLPPHKVVDKILDFLVQK